MKTILLIFVAFIFALSASTAFGQKPTSIRFARGTHETVVVGTLNGYAASKTYLLSVGKNQTITTSDVGKNQISLTILGAQKVLTTSRTWPLTATHETRSRQLLPAPTEYP